MNIEKIIKDNNLTRKAFADCIGVKVDAVYKWLAGTYPISRQNRMLIEIWLAGGDMKASFTKKEWIECRRNSTVKDLQVKIGLHYGTLLGLTFKDEFSQPIQTILRYKLG